MGKRRLNNWRWWLPTLSLGLTIFTVLAPLPDTPDKVLTLLALGGLLVYLLADSPDSRREMARFLIPLAVLVPLALLLSINPKWVIFGFIGIYAGALLWEVVRQERTEYLAERERPPEPSVSH